MQSINAQIASERQKELLTARAAYDSGKAKESIEKEEINVTDNKGNNR